MNEQMTTDNWIVKAYQHIDGKDTFVEFASGLSHRHAKVEFARLRNTNQYSKITMKEII